MADDRKNNGKVTTKFQKGQKRPAGAGRRKGTPNKVSMALRDCVIAAAEICGEKRYSKTHKAYTNVGQGGLLGYCVFLAKHHENLFAPLLSKVLPMHTTSVVANRSYRTEEEVRALCAERGINFESIMDLGEPMPRNMIDVTTVRD